MFLDVMTKRTLPSWLPAAALPKGQQQKRAIWPEGRRKRGRKRRGGGGAGGGIGYEIPSPVADSWLSEIHYGRHIPRGNLLLSWSLAFPAEEGGAFNDLTWTTRGCRFLKFLSKMEHQQGWIKPRDHFSF